MTLWRRLIGRPGLGCKRDEPDSRDQRFGALALPSVGLPAAYSMRNLVTEVLDQGSTNSCVSHSVCQAFRIARRANGELAPLSSCKHNYFHARAYHGDEREDGGTYPRSGIKALARFGAPAESEWPWSSPINRRPSWAADRAGYDARSLDSYYRIFDTGGALVDALRAAIAAGYPVVFGTAVSRSFTELITAAIVGVPPPSDPIVGRHAMVLVGYYQGPEGVRFETCNSWGTGWGNGGFAHLSESYVKWQETSDFQVLKLAS